MAIKKKNQETNESDIHLIERASNGLEASVNAQSKFMRCVDKMEGVVLDCWFCCVFILRVL